MNNDNFISKFITVDKMAREEDLKVIFLLNDNLDNDQFVKILNVNDFTDDTPYEAYILESEDDLLWVKRILSVENIMIPSLVYYFVGEIEFIKPIVNIEMIKKSNKERDKATLEDLLYLSKFITFLRQKDEIDLKSFEAAFGFIEFNDLPKAMFSGLIDIDNMPHADNAKDCIGKAKNLPKVPYNKELKKYIKELKELFGDEPIGYFR